MAFALRGLVVDDDPPLVEYLGEILGRLGVSADSAYDGREAEHRLRETAYDLVFLDVRLPFVPGDVLLQLMNRRVIPRPPTVVLMSGQPDVVPPTPTEMARLNVTGFLGKPFGLGDVKSAIASATERPRVLIIGSGLWAEGLAQVVRASQGQPLVIPTVEKASTLLQESPPTVAVVGPPLEAGDLLFLVSLCHAMGLGGGGTSVLAGLNRPDPALQAELISRGARKVAVLPRGMGELCVEMSSLSGLKRRIHARAPLACPVVLHATQAVMGALAVDLSEGGMGVAGLTDAPSPGTMEVEFALPDEPEPIQVTSHLVWTRPGDAGLRAGLRFLTMAERHRGRIRRYVDAHP